MLKIKDNVDLKQLEMFGFKLNYNSNFPESQFSCKGGINKCGNNRKGKRNI